MKKIFILLLLTLPLFAQEQKEHRIIVSGNAEMQVPADVAEFTFSVKGVGATLRGAVEDAARKVQLISNRLIKLGIPGKNIATGSFYSAENFGDKSFWSSARDYQTKMEVFVRLDSLVLLDKAIFTVSEGQIENISNISFSLKKADTEKNNVLREAVKKGKEKAEAMANQLGVSLGGVVNIEEQFSNIYTPAPRTARTMMLKADGGTENAILAHTLTLQAAVRIIFEIK